MLRNNIYLGEVYDARRELPGWSRPGLDATGWSPAALAPAPPGVLRAQMQPPIRVIGELRPVRRTEPRPGVFIFDIGQNFAGWARLRVQGPAGAKVKLRFGELLYPDGSLNVMTGVCGQIKHGNENRDGEPARLAYPSDTYILAGRGEETYTPRFTWHGFGYVEVTGYPGTPPLEAIRGLQLSADVADAGSFQLLRRADQPHPTDGPLDLPEQPLRRAVRLPATRTVRLRRRCRAHERGNDFQFRHGSVLCQVRAGFRRRGTA